jgi:hypothetical protein
MSIPKYLAKLVLMRHYSVGSAKSGKDVTASRTRRIKNFIQSLINQNQINQCFNLLKA